MNKFLTFLFLIQAICSFSQSELSLTSEEKAYLYHIVKKSPILDTNIGRYFEYKGPVIRFPNKDLNYDSIEAVIINHPEQLNIRSSEIAKSPKGIISEAANKIALWELNKVLQAKRMGEKELQDFIAQYMRFEKILLPLLPENAYKSVDGALVPHPKLDQLLNPSLSFEDKKEMISGLHFLDLNDQLVTLNALNQAVNIYVQQRSHEFFILLGGEAEIYNNVLVAAGDGSSTSGLLEEREKDERGRWNKGLPKAVGLFPYQIEIKPGDKKTKPELEPIRFAVLDFNTVGKNRITNIHPDVWGYNAEKQTTVVIEKNGLSYHLFGSGKTRFLSPDSTYSDGATFQALINDLEFNKIGKIDELIHGKKGFDYWIDYNTKKRNETELKIEKNEKAYSDMGYSPITTDAKASRKVRKHKKKSKTLTNYQPTTYSKKTKRKKEQQEIIDLYNLYEEYKLKIKELEKQKEEAIDLRAKYQRRLDYYKQLIGYRWATYTEEDGLYTFEDSTTFDIYTQEFKFPPSKEVTPFEVRLLAIPNNCLSEEADEVMLHVNLTDAKPSFDARVQIHLDDVFDSDKWQLNQQLLTKEDSVAVRQFFEALRVKKSKFEIVVRGQGIGEWDGVRTVKCEKPVELSAYPGSSHEDRVAARMDTTFQRLRKSEAFIMLNRGILLEINSYTDPVASGLNISNEVILEKMKSYKLTKNQVLSAYRSKEILLKLKQELNVLAGTYLGREEAKFIIDKINNEIQKVRIIVGSTSFKLDELN